MSHGLLRRTRPHPLRKPLLAPPVIALAVFLAACSPDAAGEGENARNQAPPAAGEVQAPGATGTDAAGTAWTAELREAEHRTIRHPEKRLYAWIWPDGLGVSFPSPEGHTAQFSFPRDAFPRGEPVYLLTRAVPDLLPMRVVRLNGDVNQVYGIEWLPESPPAGGGLRVVQSY